MGRFIITDDDLHRIDLGDGEWVDILEQVTGTIKRKAHEAMTKAGGKFTPKKSKDKSKKKDDVDTEISFDFRSGEFNRVLLQEVVKDWSFKDKDGNKNPCDAENKAKMSEELEDSILKTIEELDPLRDDDEKKD